MPATQADAVMEAWAAACRRHVGGGMGGAGGPFGGYSCGGGNEGAIARDTRLSLWGSSPRHTMWGARRG